MTHTLFRSGRLFRHYSLDTPIKEYFCYSPFSISFLVELFHSLLKKPEYKIAIHFRTVGIMKHSTKAVKFSKKNRFQVQVDPGCPARGPGRALDGVTD